MFHDKTNPKIKGKSILYWCLHNVEQWEHYNSIFHLLMMKDV